VCTNSFFPSDLKISQKLSRIPIDPINPDQNEITSDCVRTSFVCNVLLLRYSGCQEKESKKEIRFLQSTKGDLVQRADLSKLLSLSYVLQEFVRLFLGKSRMLTNLI
jgi:hypothetical protein